jgi:ketopantoate hydroxymethyltransferase
MEVVVANLMTEISARTSMRVIAFGSGNGCRAKCLFSADLLGKSRGHGPQPCQGRSTFFDDRDRL